jgi:chromatin assembly factor 1 subunit A
MSQLTGAEVAGDISLVRHHLTKLTNLTLFPRKALIFHEDLRPGYFGTWTRNSATIGPRSPFKRDQAVLDYGYDSGEEWEEEGEADDVVEDGDEEDGDADDPDSDLDSWLVDDDEVETVGQERSCSPSSVEIITPLTPPKRKLDSGDRKLGKKRKVVVPLVPFAKGPCWEPAVAQCQSDLIKPFQIRLFNGQFQFDPIQHTLISAFRYTFPY